VIDLDVRVIAATNKDLKLAIEQREFREDLYFRISTFRLRIQALKDRPGDIMPLVLQSLARHSKSDLPFTVTDEAQAMLQNYPWPGNVRELENVVQRAVVLCMGRTISPAHLMFDDAMTDREVVMSDFEVATPGVMGNSEATGSFAPIAIRSTPEPLMPVNLGDAVKTSEHQAIMAAIQSTESRMEAAAKLGISPRTLRYKLAQLRSRGMSEGVSA